MNNAKKVLGEHDIEYVKSEECLKDAEFCILATPWKEFKRLKPEDFITNIRKPVVLDC